MEGYIYKRGQKVHSMKKRFAVLQGTTLSFYQDQAECSKGALPHSAVEVVAFNGWEGKSHGFAIDTLMGRTYFCSVDTAHEKDEWMLAIQNAIDAPLVVQMEEELENRRRSVEIAEKEAEAAANAAHITQERVQAEAEVAEKWSELEKQREALKILENEVVAANRKYELHKSISVAAEHAIKEGENRISHEAEEKRQMSDGSPGVALDDEHYADHLKKLEEWRENLALLNAKVEKEEAAALDAQKDVDSLSAKLNEHKKLVSHLENEVKKGRRKSELLLKAEDDAVKLAGSLSDMSRAQRRRSSIGPRLSLLIEPLCQGYLLLKETKAGHHSSPMVALRRRYCVLVQRAFIYYAQIEDYREGSSPMQVVHVTSVGDWGGKVGRKMYPNAFKFMTLQNLLFRCSSPLEKERTMWVDGMKTALQTAPVSPKRRLSMEDIEKLKAQVAASGRPVPTSPLKKKAPLSPFENHADFEEEFDRRQKENDSSDEGSEEEHVLAEGYLLKRGHLVPNMKRRYCVLRGRTFNYFENHDQYLAGTPHGEHTVVAVADWDGEGSFHKYENAFRIDTVDEKVYYCSASNEKEKQKWMGAVRQAVAMHRAKRAKARAALAQASTALATPQNPEKLRAEQSIKKRLTQFYEDNNASNMDVEAVWYLWKDNLSEMVSSLDKQFATSLSSDEDLKADIHKYMEVCSAPQAVASSAVEPPKPLQSEQKQSSEMKLEQKVESIEEIEVGEQSHKAPKTMAAGYLFQQGPHMRHLKRRYCTLIDTKLSFYRTSEDAEGNAAPLDEVEVINTLPWDGRSMFGSHAHSFRIDTRSHGTYNCAAETSEEKRKWTTALLLALGRNKELKMVADKTGQSEGVSNKPVRLELLRKKLEDYYTKHNPEGAQNIDAYLGYYGGQLKPFLEKLDEAYGTTISVDPSWVSLLPHEHPATTAHVEGDLTHAEKGDTPHFEGYLEKKSHSLPSMNKRYFVLDGAEVCYYESFKDAKNPQIPPNDIFRLAKVFEWDGHTSFKDFAHGFAAQSDTGKLFHLVAANELEKNSWLQAGHEALAWVTTLNLRESNGEGAQSVRERQLRQILKDFYQDQNPAGTSGIDRLIYLYRGNHDQLLHDVDEFFGSRLSLRVHSQTEVDHHSQLAAGHGHSTGEEPQGFLLVGEAAAPTSVATKSRDVGTVILKGRYCVLHGRSMYVYKEKVTDTTEGALASMRILAVRKWDGGGAFASDEDVTLLGSSESACSWNTDDTHYGFECTTEGEKGETTSWVFCARNDKQRHWWMNSIRLAVDGVGPASGRSKLSPRSASRLRQALTTFFEEKNPAKVGDVDNMLSEWKGKEGYLISELDNNYGSTMTKDLADLRLGTDQKNGQHLTEHDNAILSEGDGGKIEGMLEVKGGEYSQFVTRYCVLHGSRMLFYASVDEETLRNSPEFDTEVLAIHAWDAPESTDGCTYGFCLDTPTQTPVYCVAADSESYHLWSERIAEGIQHEVSLALSEEKEAMKRRETHIEGASMEGYLAKKVSSLTHMHQVYCVLVDADLLCYANEENALHGRKLTCTIPVAKAEVWEGDRHLFRRRRGYGIKAETKNKETFFFAAASEAERKIWLDMLDINVRIHEGREILREQAVRQKEVGKFLQRVPRSTKEDYLHIKTSEFELCKERFVCLVGNNLIWYNSKAEAGSGAEHSGSFEAVSVGLWHGTEMGHRVKFGFKIDSTGKKSLYCSCPNRALQQLWIDAVDAALDIHRADELLATELASREVKSTTGTTLANSCKHGYLGVIPGRNNNILPSRTSEVYAVLLHNVVHIYKSHAEAEAGELPVVSLQITNIAIFSQEKLNHNGVSGRFGLNFSTANCGSILFSAASRDEQSAWLEAIDESLKADLREKIFQDQAPRLPSSVEANGVTEAGKLIKEGYLLIKNFQFESLKERYCRLVNENFSFYEIREHFEEGKAPLGSVEVLAARSWDGGLLGVEKPELWLEFDTLLHKSFQCRASNADEKQSWIEAITEGSGHINTNRVVARNHDLPHIDGASMEGFIEKVGAMIPKRCRLYCVIFGTSMMYYHNQDEALKNAVPLGVVEIASVLTWDDRKKYLKDHEHGFKILDTQGNLTCCIVGNELEKRSWMKAISTQLELVELETQKLIRKFGAQVEGQNLTPAAEHMADGTLNPISTVLGAAPSGEARLLNNAALQGSAAPIIDKSVDDDESTSSDDSDFLSDCSDFESKKPQSKKANDKLEAEVKNGAGSRLNIDSRAPENSPRVKMRNLQTRWSSSSAADFTSSSEFGSSDSDDGNNRKRRKSAKRTAAQRSSVARQTEESRGFFETLFSICRCNKASKRVGSKGTLSEPLLPDQAEQKAKTLTSASKAKTKK